MPAQAWLDAVLECERESGTDEQLEPAIAVAFMTFGLEAVAVLAALALLAGDRKRNAAFALAELLSRRGLERPCKLLVAWAGR